MFYRKYHLLRHQRQKHWQPFVKDSHSGTENAVHGLSENISMSEPVQPEYLFPAESLSCSGNVEPATQMHTFSDDVGYEKKQERKSSSFGEDMLTLSCDDADWTESSQRESNEPVAGCSDWSNYGEELQRDTTVSMFRYRDLLYFGYCHCIGELA